MGSCSGGHRGPWTRGLQRQSTVGGGSSQRKSPRPRLARPARSVGQIALQGAQIKPTLEFLLSTNQLISPLFKSIRDTHKWQSASLPVCLASVWLSARHSLICILMRQFSVRGRRSDL